MKSGTIIIFLLFFVSASFGQTQKKDSLLNIYNTTRVDTVKILALKDLALLLSRNSPDEAKTYCQECIELAVEADFPEGRIKCYNIMGIINFYGTDYAAAIDNFEHSLLTAIEANDQISVFRAYNNLGGIYISMSTYGKATEAYSKAVDIAEKLGDKKSMAQCYTNIAIIHKDNSDFDKAMEYNQKAEELGKELNDKLLLSQVYSNISMIKRITKNLQHAIEYAKKAMVLQAQLDDMYGIGINYINLGEYYALASQNENTNEATKNAALDSATHYYKAALTVSKQLNDNQRLCNALLGLGDISFIKKDYQSAFVYFNQVIDISKKTGIIEITMRAYSSLSKVNEALGNYHQAFENFKIFKAYSDSIYSAENRNSINELEIKYQTEKKQKEIEILNQEKAIEAFKNRILVIGVILLIVIIGIIFISLLIKRRDNRLLQQKNNEIQLQREKIQAQADILSEANHEITLQKEQIERNHARITDSIVYAQRIQDAALPSNKDLAGFLPEHFIMFRPCNIVSGDFYFAKKVGKLLFFAAADCTGHGVPGALMSMLGIALLNELVQEPRMTNAAQLLEILRVQIKSSLQQTGQMREQKEGMDIAFCILDTETNMLSYAGAYNPLWIFRKNGQQNGSREELNGSELLEFKANRQPLGVYIKEKPFTEHRLQLNPGDQLYMFSDGYYSQFGGKNNEKLKMGRFRTIITEIHHLPLDEQKAVLEEKFDAWKGHEMQIDDVLVFGVKI
ncbi:MAG: tetratricopeptide repeat protein [Bacteroidota bacterium]